MAMSNDTSKRFVMAEGHISDTDKYGLWWSFMYESFDTFDEAYNACAEWNTEYPDEWYGIIDTIDGDEQNDVYRHCYNLAD